MSFFPALSTGFFHDRRHIELAFFSFMPQEKSMWIFDFCTFPLHEFNSTKNDKNVFFTGNKFYSVTVENDLGEAKDFEIFEGIEVFNAPSFEVFFFIIFWDE